jgi:ankyrin repeat protein
MQNGATLDIPDSDGRDAMSHAVMSNNIALVKFLIENRRGGKLIIDCRDRGGKNAVHLLVKPCKFGSFENAPLLEDLTKAGYTVDLVDSSGKKPIDYARDQMSGVLLNILSKG